MVDVASGCARVITPEDARKNRVKRAATACALIVLAGVAGRMDYHDALRQAQDKTDAAAQETVQVRQHAYHAALRKIRSDARQSCTGWFTYQNPHSDVWLCKAPPWARQE